MKAKELYEEITAAIQNTYEQGVTIEEAERLAAKCLYGQLLLSAELKTSDLDARMKKAGLKAVRSAIYLDEVQKADKKPTEAALSALIDSNDLVLGEQKGYDTAEVDRDAQQRIYDVLQNAHIYFRSVAKGRFE